VGENNFSLTGDKRKKIVIFFHIVRMTKRKIILSNQELVEFSMIIHRLNNILKLGMKREKYLAG